MHSMIFLAVAFSNLPTPPTQVTASVVLRPMHDVNVPARETGPLVELLAEEGRAVEQGTVLARIDDSDAKSAVAEATADYEVAVVDAESELAIKSAEEDYILAGKKRERAVEANRLRPGSVREYQLDELRLAESQARLAVEQAKLARTKAQRTMAARAERVARARQRLQRHSIACPVSGSVVESFFERGEWVEAGQVVARVVQTDRLKAEGMLPQSQVSNNLVGLPVSVTVKAGERDVVLKGTLTFVSPEAHSTRGEVRFRAIVENPGKLVRPGLKKAELTIRPGDVVRGTRGPKR